MLKIGDTTIIYDKPRILETYYEVVLESSFSGIDPRDKKVREFHKGHYISKVALDREEDRIYFFGENERLFALLIFSSLQLME